MSRRQSTPRPLRRDPDGNRRRILAAAEREFAAHGLGGARVDRIAVAAGANKRMLYYYFRDKDGLFLAVLEAAYRKIRAAESALRLEALDPVERLRRLIAFTWSYFQENPEFISLLNTENLHQARHLRRSKRIREMNSPLIALLDETLAEGRRRRLFRGGVDPLQLYVSIAGLCWFYLSNRHTLSTVFGRDLRRPRARAERLTHMTDLILGYLLR
ncbi:MAG: TetR family transcriptional regulator [Alphaproteobacteria bacterium]|nr:TetR family transcriptional regulator [Alphaproteobacteria bacterium]